MHKLAARKFNSFSSYCYLFRRIINNIRYRPFVLAFESCNVILFRIPLLFPKIESKKVERDSEKFRRRFFSRRRGRKKKEGKKNRQKLLCKKHSPPSRSPRPWISPCLRSETNDYRKRNLTGNDLERSPAEAEQSVSPSPFIQISRDKFTSSNYTLWATF